MDSSFAFQFIDWSDYLTGIAVHFKYVLGSVHNDLCKQMRIIEKTNLTNSVP